MGFFLRQTGLGTTNSSNLGDVIMGLSFGLYLPLLPLLAGSLSVAEEKGWGTIEWQLMLPASGAKQC